MSTSIIFDDSTPYTHIRLNRPKALNAFSEEMLVSLRRAMDRTVKPVILTGEGRAFSTGGDIIAIQKFGIPPRHIFNQAGSTWYHTHKVPYEKISVLDGLTIGGGLGLGLACNSSILTKKTVISIPEVMIGHVPDVGASYFTHKLISEQFGLFLLLTGENLIGKETYFAGFSKFFIPDFTEEAKNHLLHFGLNEIEKFCQTPESLNSEVLTRLPVINQCFDINFDVETICNRLASVSSEWSQRILGSIRGACPLSLKLAQECFVRARTMDYLEVMNLEYNISVKSIEMMNSNFDIGIRHKLINKLKTRPEWIPNNLFEISDKSLEYFFRDHHFKLVNYKI